MNNSFSLTRLSGLIRKQWLENNRFYVLASLALLGVMSLSVIVFWVLSGGVRYAEKDAYIIYMVGLFIVGTIYGSISFSVLGSKEKGQYWLSFPASHAEKLVTQILYYSVFFFLVYTGLFFIVKSAAQAYIESYVATHEYASFTPMNWTGEFERNIAYVIWGYFCVQTLFILGSVYFKQYSFIKTTIFVSAFLFVFIFLFVKTMMFFFKDSGFQWEGMEMRMYHVPDNYGTYKSYKLGNWLSTFITYVFIYWWVPLFWVITWFRLKEKEL